MPYLDGLSLCKHSQYNALLSWTSKNTKHATFISLLHSLRRFSCSLWSAFENTLEITHSACFSLIDSLCETTLSPQARYENLVYIYIERYMYTYMYRNMYMRIHVLMLWISISVYIYIHIIFIIVVIAHMHIWMIHKIAYIIYTVPSPEVYYSPDWCHKRCLVTWLCLISFFYDLTGIVS